jgi:hypothetical protein
VTDSNIDTAPEYPEGNAQDAARAALELADEREALNKRIREIEDFVSGSPRRDEVKRGNLQTIPPPEPESRELYCHPVASLRSERPLIRRQAAAQLATRRKNMMIFMISAALFAVFVYWISHSL